MKLIDRHAYPEELKELWLLILKFITGVRCSGKLTLMDAFAFMSRENDLDVNIIRVYCDPAELNADANLKLTAASLL